jgi:hypothetical protein
MAINLLPRVDTMKLLLKLLIIALLLSVSACSMFSSNKQAELSITFSNESNLDICEVYISKENSNDWGVNLLIDDEMILGGNEKSFAVNRGVYDLLVRTCTKDAIFSKSGVNSDFLAVIGSSGQLPIRVANIGEIDICYFYIAPAGTGAWGEDQLGSVESINSGNSRIFFLEPGLYNLMAEDCDHIPLAQRDNYNPASETEWTIRP